MAVRRIEITAPLGTARPRIFLDADSRALLLTESGGEYTFHARGEAYFERGKAITYIDRSGTVHTLGYEWHLRPVGFNRIQDLGGDEVRVTYDT